MSVEYESSVERVHRAFGDEQYWLARLADATIGTTLLDSIQSHDDGSVAVTSTLVLPREFLPAVASQFHSGDMRIQRRETWNPMTDGKASGTIDCAIIGAPATMAGKADLSPTGAGSRMNLQATVEVRIPLIGGKLETFIGSQLTNLLIEEQRFTTTWLITEP
jgi:hypothetical protein